MEYYENVYVRVKVQELKIVTIIVFTAFVLHFKLITHRHTMITI